MKALKFYCVAILLVSFSTVYGQKKYSPLKMFNTLAELTQAKLLPQREVNDLVSIGKCKYLTEGRSYAAPIGLLARSDVKNGAKGIDEWVVMDKGNAYVLTNYKWIPADMNGSTQLILDFDTLHCEHYVNLD